MEAATWRTERIAIAGGSERRPPENARAVGDPNPGDAIQVSVVLRRRAPLAERHHAARISREQFAAEYGADPADVVRVEDFAQRYELTVAGVDLGRRTVLLSGTIAAMNEAFGTTLKLYQGDQGTFRARAGALYLAADLAEAVVGVFGLDNRPQAFTRCRRKRILAGRRATGDTSYSPVDVARLYQFPSGATGSGQTVAIIELGGGYKAADLKSYFGTLGISPVPSVTAVSVDGAKNAPTGDPNSADGEVVLDISRSPVRSHLVPGLRSTSRRTPIAGSWMRSQPPSTTPSANPRSSRSAGAARSRRGPPRRFRRTTRRFRMRPRCSASPCAARRATAVPAMA